MRNEGRCVELNMPPGTAKSINHRRMMYHTINCRTRKIENVPIDEVEEALSIMKEEIKFSDRAVNYETIEVQFADQEAAKKCSLRNRKNDKWWQP